MTRGKFASNAAARVARESAQSEATKLRHANAALAARNRDLENELLALKVVHKNHTARLAERIDAQTSDALDSANEMIRDLRGSLGDANRDATRIKKSWGRSIGRLHEYIFQKERGTREEALETLFSMVGDDLKEWRIDWDDMQKHGLSGEAILRIQRARGIRS